MGRNVQVPQSIKCGIPGVRYAWLLLVTPGYVYLKCFFISVEREIKMRDANSLSSVAGGNAGSGDPGLQQELTWRRSFGGIVRLFAGVLEIFFLDYPQNCPPPYVGGYAGAGFRRIMSDWIEDDHDSALCRLWASSMFKV
jgi:hypothetical protein